METKNFVKTLIGVRVFAMVLTAAVLILGAADKAYPIPQPSPVKTYVLDEDLTPELMNNLARNMPNWITTYLLNNTNAFTITPGDSLLVQGHARVRLLYITENMIFSAANGDTIVLKKARADTVEVNHILNVSEAINAQTVNTTNLTSTGAIEAATISVSASATVPTPTMANQAANKAYVESYVAAQEFSIPYAQIPPTECNNTYEGSYYTDTDDWKIRVCNGTDWVLATNTGNENFPVGTDAPNAAEGQVAAGYEYVGVGTQAREVGTAILLPSGTSVTDARAFDVVTNTEFITIDGLRTTGTLTSYLPVPTGTEPVAIASNVQMGTQFWLIDPFGGGQWLPGTLSDLLPAGTSSPDASPSSVRSGHEYVNIGSGEREMGSLSVLLPSGTDATDATASDVRTGREFVAYGTQARVTGTGGSYFVPSGTNVTDALSADVRTSREFVDFFGVRRTGAGGSYFVPAGTSSPNAGTSQVQSGYEYVNIGTGSRQTGTLSVLLPTGTSIADAAASHVLNNREFVAYGTQARTTGTGGDYFVPSGTAVTDAVSSDVRSSREFVDFSGTRRTGTLTTILPSGTSVADAAASHVLNNREFITISGTRTTGVGGDYFVPAETGATNAVASDVRSSREFVDFSGIRITGTLSVLLPSGTSVDDAEASHVLNNREFVAYGTQARTTGTGGNYFVPSGTVVTDALSSDVLANREFVNFSGTRITGTGGNYFVPSGTVVADAISSDVRNSREFVNFSGTRTTGAGGDYFVPAGTSADDAVDSDVRAGREFVNFTGTRTTGTGLIVPSGTGVTDALSSDVRTNREFVNFSGTRITGMGGDYFVPAGTSADDAVDSDVRSGREFVSFTGTRTTGAGGDYFVPAGTSADDAVDSDVRAGREFVNFTGTRTTGTGLIVPSGTGVTDALSSDVRSGREFVSFTGGRVTGSVTSVVPTGTWSVDVPEIELSKYISGGIVLNTETMSVGWGTSPTTLSSASLSCISFVESANRDNVSFVEMQQTGAVWTECIEKFGGELRDTTATNFAAGIAAQTVIAQTWATTFTQAATVGYSDPCSTAVGTPYLYYSEDRDRWERNWGTRLLYPKSGTDYVAGDLMTSSACTGGQLVAFYRSDPNGPTPSLQDWVNVHSFVQGHTHQHVGANCAYRQRDVTNFPDDFYRYYLRADSAIYSSTGGGGNPPEAVTVSVTAKSNCQ